ncbi:head-tail connector protein [Enterococcus cecorum]|uniref:head-tail connector protein n=1 Tax=Enterococcus cecorum TaxID=44008 RepID=UPI00148E082D|nr:head-tail connector protein [Enterococcus cecorum]
MDNVELVEKLKKHLNFEEGMDESMLSFYLEKSKKYVKRATGKEDEYLMIMVAGIMYDYRVSETDLTAALDALTPFFIQEAFDDEETSE